MPITELEELQLRRQLRTGGLSELEELNIRRALKSGEVPQAQVPPEQPEEAEFIDELIGGGEAVGTILSTMAAEPIAGLTGLAKTITSGPEAGEETASQFREALTFLPRTEIGKKRVANIAGALAPVGEALLGAEKFLGDAAFNATPFLDPTSRALVSATAASLPASILELLNIKGARQAAKLKAGLKTAKVGRQAKKLLTDAVPTKEALFAQGNAAFGKIDELGASIKPKAYDKLVKRIARRMDIEEGITPGSQPNTNRTLNELQKFTSADEPLNLKRLENLRRNAKANAAKARAAGDDLDARLAESIADDIDIFLEEGGTNILNFPEGKRPANIGKAYKDARKIWGQAKRTETLEEMVENAGRARTGFRPGLEAEFAKLVRNKRKSQFWKKSELKIMDDFAQGKTGAQDKLIRLVAGLSPTEGGTNRRILTTLVLGGGGASLLGPAAAPIGPALGFFAHTLSKSNAEDMARTLKNMVAAGDDGKEIAKAYVRGVPKRLRNPEDLGRILAERGAELDNLVKTEFMRKAAEVANQQKAALARGTAATAAVVSTKEAQENQGN